MKLFLTLAFTCLFFAAQSQVKRISMGEHVRRTSIYPNPARSFVQIQYRIFSDQPTTLVVYNFLGKKQLEVQQPGSHVFVDLAEFKRGLYIFQFRDKNGRILDSGKFHVEK